MNMDESQNNYVEWRKLNNMEYITCNISGEEKNMLINAKSQYPNKVNYLQINFCF